MTTRQIQMHANMMCSNSIIVSSSNSSFRKIARYGDVLAVMAVVVFQSIVRALIQRSLVTSTTHIV